MNNKLFKPFLLIFTIVLIVFFWMQKSNLSVHALLVDEIADLEKEKVLSTELDLQIYIANNAFTLNYDKLNRTTLEYRSFNKRIQNKYKQHKVFQELAILAARKIEKVDYFKRSNSIMNNSIKYINNKILDTIFMKNNILHTGDTKQSSPLFRLFFEYTDGNYHIEDEVRKEAQRFKSFSYTNKKAKKAQKYILMHINVVLNEGNKLNHSLQDIEALNSQINMNVANAIEVLRKNEIRDHARSTKYSNIMFGLITLMTLLIYFITNKVLSQNTKIKEHATDLEDEIEKATQEIKMHNETYEKIFYRSVDGIVLVSEGRINDCNDAMLKLLGYTKKEELLGLSPSDLSPKYQFEGELSIELQERNINKLFTQGPQRFEWLYVKADGNELWTEVILTIIKIKGKDMVYGVSRDITDRKELEMKLENINESLQEKVIEAVNKNQEQTAHMLQQSRHAQMGEMISMIAHQWRQPLASISAIAGTLGLDVMMDQYKKEFFQERLESITGLSQHLSSTIDDFRGFFKEEKELKNTSLHDIVHSSLNIIGPALKNKGIEIHENIDQDVIIDTYSNEVTQVLLNLLKNAEEALEDKDIKEAKISIKGYKKNNMAYLSIEDNAKGIAEEISEKIFDPYFSTKTKKDGTGLGMYMSKTIIEEHCGGKLQFHNTKEGACFVLTLPLEVK